MLDDFSLLQLSFSEAILRAQRPLTYFTFWLNAAGDSPEPWAFRLGNILLHSLAVQLCFRALRALVPEQRAFWAALLFALHPLQAEAVLYVFARPVILMGIFVWASIEQWLRGRHWLAVTLGVLALTAKEEAVALPVVLCLLGGPWRPLAAAFAAAALAALLTFTTTANLAGSGAGVAAGISPWDYLATQIGSLARYTKDFFLPYPLVFDHPVAPLPRAAMIVWGFIGVAFWWKRNSLRHRGPVFWLALGLLFLLPTTSIFPLADFSAGRRMYLPIACLAAALLPLPKANLIVGALLGALTLSEAMLWSSPVCVWRRTYEHTNSLRPALALSRLVPPAEARAILEARRTVGESQSDFHTELGRLALADRDAAAALRHFGKALALDPDRASHHYNRGVALQALGQSDAARADFQRALQIDPQHPLARKALMAPAN